MNNLDNLIRRIFFSLLRNVHIASDIVLASPALSKLNKTTITKAKNDASVLFYSIMCSNHYDKLVGSGKASDISACDYLNDLYDVDISDTNKELFGKYLCENFFTNNMIFYDLGISNYNRFFMQSRKKADNTMVSGIIDNLVETITGDTSLENRLLIAFIIYRFIVLTILLLHTPHRFTSNKNKFIEKAITKLGKRPDDIEPFINYEFNRETENYRCMFNLNSFYSLLIDQKILKESELEKSIPFFEILKNDYISVFNQLTEKLPENSLWKGLNFTLDTSNIKYIKDYKALGIYAEGKLNPEYISKQKIRYH